MGNGYAEVLREHDKRIAEVDRKVGVETTQRENLKCEVTDKLNDLDKKLLFLGVLILVTSPSIQALVSWILRSL